MIRAASRYGVGYMMTKPCDVKAVAARLKDLAEQGLFFIGAPFNPEPAKHLTTFVDFVKEYFPGIKID